ncbi:hypothetical protein H3S84_03825 [Bartonella sp. W8098]|uniref:hypothetical protein n=1 Tax=Bartonella apis TaxID=1686310 RepID=UPI0018DE4B88|nr:hypothetical protein [Bartonella apis]MBH9987397.1 hypothetical protein [Bartonella apis]MBI0171594.1 hypothetical protein [Bartonella sp. W8151]
MPKNFNYEKNSLLYPVQSERKYRKIGNEVPKTVFQCTGHLIEKFKIIVKKRDDGASCPVTTIPMITGKIAVRKWGKEKRATSCAAFFQKLLLSDNAA